MEQSLSWEARSSSARRKISAFYATRRFINVFTKARHYPYSDPDQIIPLLSNPVSWTSIFILSFLLRHSRPGDLFPSGFPHQNYLKRLVSPIRATSRAHLILYVIIQVMFELLIPTVFFVLFMFTVMHVNVSFLGQIISKTFMTCVRSVLCQPTHPLIKIIYELL